MLVHKMGHPNWSICYEQYENVINFFDLLINLVNTSSSRLKIIFRNLSNISSGVFVNVEWDAFIHPSWLNCSASENKQCSILRQSTQIKNYFLNLSSRHWSLYVFCHFNIKYRAVSTALCVISHQYFCFSLRLHQDLSCRDDFQCRVHWSVSKSNR